MGDGKIFSALLRSCVFHARCKNSKESLGFFQCNGMPFNVKKKYKNKVFSLGIEIIFCPGFHD